MNEEQDAYDNGYKGDQSHSWRGAEAHRQGLEDGGHLGNSACFPGDAKILTPTGLVRLDTLKAGDLVVSWQEAMQRWVDRPIKKVKAHGPKPIVCVHFADGRSLRVTRNHTIRTVEAWKRIDKLQVGDIVAPVSEDHSEVRVVGVCLTSEVVPVYNLYCEGEYSFVADGVIAHSFTVLRETRTMLHRLADAMRAYRRASRPWWYLDARKAVTAYDSAHR